MPVIIIKTGKTPLEKKKELIEKITNVAVDVTSLPASAFTIFIEEYDSDSIGIGGQTLSEKMTEQ